MRGQTFEGDMSPEGKMLPPRFLSAVQNTEKDRDHPKREVVRWRASPTVSARAVQEADGGRIEASLT
jgi:hypothetical protein